MAEKLKKPDAPETENATAPKVTEPEYSVEEFAANAVNLFGAKANADIVVAAFRMVGKRTATLSEAKDIVGKFIGREVK